MKNKSSDRLFDCPACGNPLYESDKPQIRCKYCNTLVIPKSTKLKREESIYIGKKEEDAKV